jgi:phosphomannomutase/phosphoglucomutase
MKETKAALAGEMSGHIFFADRWFGFDDAIYASARLYEIVGRSQTLSALTSDLKPAVNTPEIRIDCEEDKKFALIQEAAKLLLDPKATLTTIDGLRVDFEDHWGLIRASNTQPVIVMRFEAQSESKLNEIRTKFENALNAAACSAGCLMTSISATCASRRRTRTRGRAGSSARLRSKELTPSLHD